MNVMSPSQTLAAALRECTIDHLGQSKVRGVHVSFDPESCEAVVSIVLVEDTAQNEVAARRSLLEVEESYDELVLLFRFVDQLLTVTRHPAIRAVA